MQNCLCVTWWVVGSFDYWWLKALLEAHLPLELSFCIRVIRDQSTSLPLSSTGLFDTSTQSEQTVFLHLENSTSEQVHEQNGKMSAYKVHLTIHSNKVWLSQNHTITQTYLMAKHLWMSEQIYLDHSLFRNSSVHYWWHLLSLCFWKNLLTTFFYLAFSSYQNCALLNVIITLVLEVAFPVPGMWFLGTDDLSLYPFKSSFSLVCSSCSKAEVSYYLCVVMSLLCHIQASNLLQWLSRGTFRQFSSAAQWCPLVFQW